MIEHDEPESEVRMICSLFVNKTAEFLKGFQTLLLFDPKAPKVLAACTRRSKSAEEYLQQKRVSNGIALRGFSKPSA
jgi:hypothetical protein